MVDNKKIFALRSERNITQEELADILLVTRTMISHIERGAKQPSVDMLQRIAEYFNCTVDDLLIKPKKDIA